jgi:GPH family glycoside/pentoside/hexuronide:cation symporter
MSHDFHIPHGSPTPSSAKVRTGQKVLFGIGSMSQSIGSSAITNLASYVFNIGFGLNPMLVSLAQAVPRLWDAVTDPVMGYISDRTRTRWGRRRPYMLLGALCAGISFALIWQVPSQATEMYYFLHLLVMSLVFYTFLTVFSVPWGALGIELTGDYNERTSVMAYATFIGTLSGLVLPWLFKATRLPFFENETAGARGVGIALGGFILLAGVVCALGMREQPSPGPTSKAPLQFVPAISQTLRNRSFLILCSATFLILGGFYMVASLSGYVVIYWVFGGDTDRGATWVGLTGTAWILSGLAFVAPATWLSSLVGKRGALLTFIVIMAVGHCVKYFCYSKTHIWLMLLPPVLISAGFAAVWTLGASMLADVADVDHLTTGEARQATYSATYSWIIKAGSSAAVVLSGFILQFSGFDQALGAAQLPWSLNVLRGFEIAMPTLCLLGAAILIGRYPLTESVCRHNRELIAKMERNEAATTGKPPGTDASDKIYQTT